MQVIADQAGSLQATRKNGWTSVSLSSDLEIKQPGYILIFTKARSARSVYRDEVLVKVRQGAVLEQNPSIRLGLR